MAPCLTFLTLRVQNKFMKYDKIPSQLFTENRQRFVKHLKPKSIAIFNSNDIMPTNADGVMKFIQNKDIFHLSGADQEESVLVLFPDAYDHRHREILFLKETNDHIARWEGAKLDKDQGTEVSGIENIMWLKDLEVTLANLMSQAEHVYLNTNEHLRRAHEVETRDDRFRKWLQERYPLHRYERSEPIMHQIRAIKLPIEVELMQRVSKTNFSNEAFPWLSGQEINVGLAPTWAIRMNFVGELGWELHHPIEYQNHIFDKLMEAGKDLGLKPYGIRAMNSLRVEKSYKLVGTELSIEYSPYESGLDRFIHPNKGKFIGLEALNKWREKGFKNKLVTLELHNVTDADVLGNNPIYQNGNVVGRATGGDFGFRLNKSIALGMIKPELATTGQKLKIDILGKMHDATILDESPYDPENKLLRA